MPRHRTPLQNLHVGYIPYNGLHTEVDQTVLNLSLNNIVHTGVGGCQKESEESRFMPNCSYLV